jgi:glycosyltransferase involved in cell wall biosynthesis
MLTHLNDASAELDAARSAAVNKSDGSRLRRPRPISKPRIAIFSPFPPLCHGVSDYSMGLALELAADYRIDMFHDPGYTPTVPSDFPCYDYRVFERVASAVPYRAILYQLSNTYEVENFVYESLLLRPGIVTLHDFCLSGFHWYRAHPPAGRADPALLLDEVRYSSPDRFDEIASVYRDWGRKPGGFPAECLRHGVYLNRRVFDRAAHVLVHSSWCLERARRLFPEHSDRVSRIEMGTRVDLPEVDRLWKRERFGVPPDALVFASFGIIFDSKLCEESIRAFAEISREFPSAIYMFVGPDNGSVDLGRVAQDAGIGHRVHFLGCRIGTDYTDLLAISDIGVNLRRPPTHGETSAALIDLLRSGVPTIVLDVDTFSEFPDPVVCKVKWRPGMIPALGEAMRTIARDTRRRDAMGSAARAHVRLHHSWRRVASLYAERIESTASPGGPALSDFRQADGIRTGRIHAQRSLR